MSEKLLLECYPSIRKENAGFGVKECPTHAMRRVLQTLVVGHPLIGSFMTEFSLAMYELDAEDQERVKKELRRDGKTAEEIAALSLFKFWHHHPAVKRRVRQPDGPKGLVAEFDKFLNRWRDADTMTAGRLLFTEGDFGSEVMIAKVRALMATGYLSDPIGYAMHINVAAEGARLPRYITKRGNSQLEGYHSHLHKCMRDASNVGPELADFKMLAFNFRCSVNAGIRNRHEIVFFFLSFFLSLFIYLFIYLFGKGLH